MSASAYLSFAGVWVEANTRDSQQSVSLRGSAAGTHALNSCGRKEYWVTLLHHVIVVAFILSISSFLLYSVTVVTINQVVFICDN